MWKVSESGDDSVFAHRLLPFLALRRRIRRGIEVFVSVVGNNQKTNRYAMIII